MAMTYNKLFTRGTSAVFKVTSPVDGKIRFVTDDQELYIDFENAHVKICDIVQGYTEAQIKALLAAQILTNKLYLSSDTRHLFIYNSSNSEWIDLSTNHTHTKDQVGLGNVDNTSDATKKANFTGTIADQNTGFITGNDAYHMLDNYDFDFGEETLPEEEPAEA